MSMLTTEVLADLNREHHAELMREAATMRLMREAAKEEKEEAAANAEKAAAPAKFWASLLALPERLKPA